MEKKTVLIIGICIITLLIFVVLFGGNSIFKSKIQKLVTINTTSQENHANFTQTSEADKNPYYIDENAKDCIDKNQCYRDEDCYMLCQYSNGSLPVRCPLRTGHTGKCMKVPCYEYCVEDSPAHLPCCPKKEINVIYGNTT